MPSHVPEVFFNVILYLPLSARTALRTVSTLLRSYLSTDTLFLEIYLSKRISKI